MLPNDTTSNLDTEKKERKLTPQQAADEVLRADEERKEILAKLATAVTDKFVDRAKRRGDKEFEWLRAERLYHAPLQGSNTSLPDKPFERGKLHHGRPEPNIVRTKCDTAVANSYSLQFGAGEKNWDMFPPPNETNEKNIASCRNMEKEIHAQLLASNYGMHCRRAMEERVIYGSGVLKGPVNTGKLKIEYVQNEGTREWYPKVTESKSPKVTNVPVWRFYPDMGVTDFSEGEDTIEVHPMSIFELSQYRNHPGFDKEAITEILQGNTEHEPIKPSDYNDNMIKLSAEHWARNPYLYKDRFAVLEYHGPVTYDDVQKLGLTPTYDSRPKNTTERCGCVRVR